MRYKRQDDFRKGGKQVAKFLLVEDAAKQMGITGGLLREGLKQEKFPFGVAVKMKKRYAYYINPALFEKYLQGELVAQAEQNKSVS